MTTIEIVIVVLLGVIASSVVLLFTQLRAFMLWTRPSFPWREKWSRHPYLFESPLMEIIARAERNSGVSLTWAAREMLIIPVLEIIELEGRVDWQEVDSSILAVVSTIAEHRPPETMPTNARTSISVIRGFFQRFCNIPPFCSRKEG